MIKTKTFKHSGLHCKMILTDMGYWCGYVGVPGGHRLHGVRYIDKIEVPREILERPINVDDVGAINLLCADVKEGDTAIELVLAIDVHGGLTYAQEGDDGLWWLGFDCAHAGDARSPDSEDEFSTWKDEAFVRSNCERLADQVVALA